MLINERVLTCLQPDIWAGICCIHWNKSVERFIIKSVEVIVRTVFFMQYKLFDVTLHIPLNSFTNIYFFKNAYECMLF